MTNNLFLTWSLAKRAGTLPYYSFIIIAGDMGLESSQFKWEAIKPQVKLGVKVHSTVPFHCSIPPIPDSLCRVMVVV